MAKKGAAGNDKKTNDKGGKGKGKAAAPAADEEPKGKVGILN